MDTEIIGKQSRSKVRNYSINTVWDMKKGSVGPEMCGSLNRKASLTLLILLFISAVIMGWYGWWYGKIFLQKSRPGIISAIACRNCMSTSSQFSVATNSFLVKVGARAKTSSNQAEKNSSYGRFLCTRSTHRKPLRNACYPNQRVVET